MSNSSVLFEAFEHSKLSLNNRIVMAPMTRNYAPGNVVNQQMIDYYRRRAEGGVGMIITEGACPDHPSSSGFPNVPFIGRDDTADGWQKLVEAVHEFDCRIAAQIWHVGALRKPGTEPGGDTPGYSPSGITKSGGKKVGHEMSQQDIDEVVAAYARAGAQAKEVGFDALEIHAAHGYLIDQFFWSGTNLRKDSYGGDLVARTRFGCEVVQAIRSEVGEDFPVIMRFSQWKQQDYTARLCDSPDELQQFLQPLKNAGVDIFHCSTRRFWEPEFAGSDLNLAGWTKQLSGLPSISVGSIGLDSDFVPAVSGVGKTDAEPAGIDKLLECMERGEFDLAAVGRALIADPDWPNKIRDNRLDDLAAFEREMLAELN